MFLTDVQMYQLTDRRQKGAQIEWLQERMWLYETTATGHPRVAIEYMRQRMVKTDAELGITPRTKPDFSKLKRKTA